jgi:uncharacterized protein YjbI with pentapeptide repeats
MEYKAFISLSLFALAIVRAEDVEMKAEKAMVITFPSQTQRNYKLLGAENASGSWTTLQDGIVGTGGEVTIFYKSESDQKLFFKVETSEGPAGQRSLLSLANLDISNKDLSGYDLEGDDLRGFKFMFSTFDGANLSAANLSEAIFHEAKFVGADLSHAIAYRVNFQQANFNGANLKGIRFVGCYAAWADFRNANLKDVQFDGTVLYEANFSGQTLTNVSFRAAGTKWYVDNGVGMTGADFSGANLTGADLSRSSAAGIKLGGANISGVNFEGSNLGNVSLNGMDLRTVFLRGILTAGDWSGVNANEVDMSLASVAGWNPTGGIFLGANLEGISAGVMGSITAATNVNFRNANLRGAYLEGVVFRNCDFTGADLSFANVIAADFTGCIGLDPEQPGMQFGGWPQNPPPAPPRPTATILPDGTPREGTNPGTGLAPATVPAKLQLMVSDGATNSTTNLQFTGWNGANVWGQWPVAEGKFTYEARGRKAVLRLGHDATASTSVRTLLFTSASGGDMYNSDSGGSFKIGTFTVLQ